MGDPVAQLGDERHGHADRDGVAASGDPCGEARPSAISVDDAADWPDPADLVDDDKVGMIEPGGRVRLEEKPFVRRGVDQGFRPGELQGDLRPREVSTASKTRPPPPRPSSSMISNRPKRRGWWWPCQNEWSEDRGSRGVKGSASSGPGLAASRRRMISSVPNGRAHVIGIRLPPRWKRNGRIVALFIGVAASRRHEILGLFLGMRLGRAHGSIRLARCSHAPTRSSGPRRRNIRAGPRSP